ncbi:macrolide transport system ATP-binding/permease protein [Nocardioides albertanoniae]|uniref:Macrolide transport system ATP-binding/permease protein n=1 Tax=Nocardioides albertanoniae TaxID=1175486 RepID=A0A543A6T5_9ACTN|nr:ABC-F family ATP-binding cassette domain-containing protein [Nocardioides albertanoniae]TQL68323.1 macrolide transport system ATP-binding/permease protein [Nocardioides albertanoniae]
MSFSITSSGPILVRDLSVSFRSGSVLAGIDLTVSPGERIALVGENGAGKSTLLRAIAHELPLTAQRTGTLESPDDLVWLPQEPPFRDEASIEDVLATTLRPLREAVETVEKLADRLDEPEIAETYASALDFAVAHDAWDADRRALLAADRLGLSGLDRERPISTLSGGQRTRLALATAITRRPDALLLDEPTNHLDDDAVAVLGEFLRELPGAVLMASHDRVFLDEVATGLFDLDPVPHGAGGTDGAGGRLFGGGWTAYEDARKAARERWEQTFTEQQDELKRLRAATKIGNDAIAHNRGPTDNDKFIYKFKGSNVERSLARRKKDATRRLEDAEETQVRKPPPPLHLSTGLSSAGAAGRVAVVRDLVVEGRLELPVLDITAGEHVLITGPNGSGKSTLLGVLSGRVEPTSGEVQIGARHVEELTQDPQFGDLRRKVRDVYEESVGEELADRVPLRGLGLVHPRDLGRPVGALSVGQRRRLDLAIAVATGPDLLLLDEPTNHISLTLAGELEEAIGVTPGTVVVASHDRWLRRGWSGAELQLRP